MNVTVKCFAVAATAILLGACAPTTDFSRYAESVTAFKTATDQTSQAVAVHILSVRDIDRTRMFTQLAENPNPCDIGWVKQGMNSQKNYEPQQCAFKALEIIEMGRFSREAIAVRRQVFDMLNQYTTLLNAVIESDAPARWDSAAKGLFAASNALLTTVDSVKPANNGDTLGPLKKLLDNDGPLMRLISFAGQEWINYRRTQVLDAVITEVKPQIDQISMLLREDFEFVRKRETFEAGYTLSDLKMAYASYTYTICDTADENCKENLSKEEERRMALTKVRNAIVENETKLAEIQSIGSAMDAFNDAHDALVAYAVSAKKPKDIATLEPFVKRYSAAANDAYQAYKVIFNKRAR